MKTSFRIAIVVLISASGAFYFLNRSNPIQAPMRKTHFSENALPSQTTLGVSLVSAATVIKSTSVNPSAAQIAPQQDEVRNEVRKNPESTPASLLFFASIMGKRFQIAMLSQANATNFFEDIYSCVDDVRPIAASARALCLREGERLTHYYPVLRSNFEFLASRATPEVRNLALNRH
jgi:hypothetical protein